MQYSPISNLSLNLTHSIPKKVLLTLKSINGCPVTNGQFNKLRWNFPDDMLNSFIEIDMPEGKVRIDWKMDIFSAEGTTASHVFFLDLENHLDWFVELEKNVYDDLAKIEQFYVITNQNAVE